jgi:hypothetical protein
MGDSTIPDGSALLSGLMEHNVEAKVTDLDHYRVHGGLTVETDYIITISPKEESEGIFETFKYDGILMNPL